MLFEGATSMSSFFWMGSRLFTLHVFLDAWLSTNKIFVVDARFVAGQAKTGAKK
jgi:hypothetical protein